MKTCKTCGHEKPLDEFCRDKHRRDGHADHCRVCSAERQRKWRAENANLVKTHSQRYYDRNRETILARVQKRRADNPERQAEIEKARYARHRDKRLSANRKYRAENRTQVDAKIKEWRAAHPEAVIQWRRDADRRNSADPAYRLKKRIAAALRRSLRDKGGRPSLELLGFTADELKAHIERQFLRGMSWENMGEWHIDHIVPLSSFDLESLESGDFKRAWSLPNLRPMWGTDNVRKHAKRMTLL